MMYEIQKNVPIPKSKALGGGNALYPWDDMEIGDSFFVPANGKSLKSLQYSLSSNCTRQRKTNGRLFITRTVGDGIRVWRVAPKLELVAAE